MNIFLKMSTVKRNEPCHSDFNESDNKIIKQLLHNSDDGRTTFRKIFRIKIRRPFTYFRPSVGQTEFCCKGQGHFLLLLWLLSWLSITLLTIPGSCSSLYSLRHAACKDYPKYLQNWNIEIIKNVLILHIRVIIKCWWLKSDQCTPRFSIIKMIKYVTVVTY